MTDLPVRLRPLRLDDQEAVRAAHRAMAADNFEFAFDLTEETDWPDYVAGCARRQGRTDLPAGHVPASYLLAVSGNIIIGRSSIRHQLNDKLRADGGHIGYCVLPDFRHRGVATEILRQSLIIARAFGVADALLTCDVDNTASQTVIERCGGVLDPGWPQTETTPAKRRYWIT